MPQLPAVFGLPMANHKTGSQVHTYASCQWAASIRDYMTCETITGRGDWMEELLLDGLYIQEGFVRVRERPGLGIDLNPEVVKAHLAPGETWWGSASGAVFSKGGHRHERKGQAVTAEEKFLQSHSGRHRSNIFSRD